MADKKCIAKKREKVMLNRLNRIAGQINGLRKMILEGRYCLEILQQISSTHEAMRGVGKIIMRNYLENCATEAMRSGKKEKRDKIYEDLIEIVYKFAK